MIRVAVAGATGKLGAPICDAVDVAGDLDLRERVAPSLGRSVIAALAGGGVDVLVDVTAPDAVADNVRAAIDAGVAVVVGTSGLADADRVALDRDARVRGVPVLVVPNFAIGAVLMMRFAAEAARVMPECEIVEEHAVTKRDRPSGTALHTAAAIEAAGAPRPAIHSVRLPGLVAHQSVIFGAPGQTLTIRHDTSSREAFVPGALLAIRRVRELPPGFTVGLDAVL